MMHTTADDPKKYRSAEEVALWKRKEPLIRYTKYLQDKGILTEPQLTELEEEIKQEIQDAINRAEQQMKTLGDPLDMFDHLYAELPPSLLLQKNALKKALENSDKEDQHG
jgi:pyruvate dehydrogenase E1 component alpha subunit